MHRLIFILTIAISLTTSATAATTGSSPVFIVDEGVDFGLGNVGASDYLFNWTDPDGGPSFTNEVDPTLILTAGETYTFVRDSSAHPFIIMDSSAESFISGTDGLYDRTTTDGAVLEAATLQPIADFTADPAPSGDVIIWTPAVGEYWYTCRVTGHTAMTGLIQVVPEPTSFSLLGLGVLALILRSRKR